jgi:hypothetical protein
MTTSYDIDPHAPTVAAAWASSSLGQPDTEVGHGFVPANADAVIAEFAEPPTAKRAMVAAGVACAIAAGALTGVTLFYAGDSAQPAVTVPAPDPRPAVLVGPSTAVPAPAPTSAPTAAHPAPRVAQLPVSPSPSNIATPPPVAPQPDTTVVIDIPPLPDDPAPAPPKPPLSTFPNFTPPPAKPKPPLSMPDLTLAPKPPAPKPPVLIDPILSP